MGNRKGKIGNRSIMIDWFIVLLLPLYSLPWVVSRMIRLEKTAFVQFAFFMGLLALLYPPIGDMYKYARDYYLYKDLNWDEFIFAACLTHFDFLLPLISYAFGKIGLNNDLIRFLYNFLGYFLISKLFIKIICGNSQYCINKEFIIRALIIFVPFSIIIYAFRTNLSLVFFIYGTYNVIYENKKVSGWLYVFFSVFNHISYLIFALVLLLSRYVRFSLSKNTLIIIAILAIIFNGFMTDLFHVLPLPVELAKHLSSYIDGYEAKEIAQDSTFRAKLMGFFTQSYTYIVLLFSISIYGKSTSNEKAIITFFLIICMLSMPFVIMNQRFLLVLELFLEIFLLRSFDGTNRMKNMFKVLFVMSLVANIFNLWSYRRQISISDYDMLFTSTSYGILTHSYTEGWTDRNVDELGGLKNVSW